MGCVDDQWRLVETGAEDVGLQGGGWLISSGFRGMTVSTKTNNCSGGCLVCWWHGKSIW